MSNAPKFPPLLTGAIADDPFNAALSHAKAGGDPAHVFWLNDGSTLQAAIVLAPEMPLSQAMGGLFAVQLGLNDALGSLVPPELPVQFAWPNRLLVNGGLCGGFRAVASVDDPDEEPEWLVIGFNLPILPVGDFEPGLDRFATTLSDEGCGDISPNELIESWSRHTLLWLHRFLDGGLKPLHEAWHGKCDDIGTDITSPKAGHFVGIDDQGAMILRIGEITEQIPLTDMLESHR